jgi:hypothetical protein
MIAAATMQLEHRNKITPYAGRQVLGRVVRMLLRGETIFELNADGIHFRIPLSAFCVGAWGRHE